ncbi:MAG: signal peptide peptidase SppA [Syntrophomonadaceae bacterium]|nr:signal peptide peptidase SppA [Syntrophomonadaceae bacterium]
MRKKLVVSLFLLFLLVMTILAIKSVGNPAGSGGIAAGGAVGVIEINGSISGGNADSWMGATGANSMRIMNIIQQVGKRDDIKVVVVRIDSPGGTSVASQEIAIELDKLRENGKTVIASMGDVCASGGYWIACSSDYIVANEGTLTGSIGVIMQFTNLEGLYKKIGISEEVIKSGSLKDIGSPTRELTAEERKLLQDIVGDSYDQFIEQVLKGREGKISRDKLLKIADGRIISGRQALELGLVDSLGNYYDALDIAAEKGGLGENYKVEVLSGTSFWDSLFMGVSSNILKGSSSSVQLKY